MITLPVQDREPALTVTLSCPTVLSEDELTDIHRQVSIVFSQLSCSLCCCNPSALLTLMHPFLRRWYGCCV